MLRDDPPVSIAALHYILTKRAYEAAAVRLTDAANDFNKKYDAFEALGGFR